MIELIKDIIVGAVGSGLVLLGVVVLLSCLHSTASIDKMDAFISASCLTVGVLILWLALS